MPTLQLNFFLQKLNLRITRAKNIPMDVSIEEKILKDGTEDCLSQKNDPTKRTFDCQWCDKRFTLFLGNLYKTK